MHWLEGFVEYIGRQPSAPGTIFKDMDDKTTVLVITRGKNVGIYRLDNGHETKLDRFDLLNPEIERFVLSMLIEVYLGSQSATIPQGE